MSVFALNLTTGLGLGLAVDYSLLLVARFREERAAGHGVDAGRLPHRSGSGTHGTVQRRHRRAVAPCARRLSDPVCPIVRICGRCGSGGRRAGGGARRTGTAHLLRVPTRAGPASARRRGWWGRQAARVVRRPLAWSLAVVVVLVAVGMPFLGLNAGRIDERVLPETNGAGAGAELCVADSRSASSAPSRSASPGSMRTTRSTRRNSGISSIPCWRCPMWLAWIRRSGSQRPEGLCHQRRTTTGSSVGLKPEPGECGDPPRSQRLPGRSARPIDPIPRRQESRCRGPLRQSSTPSTR